MSDSSVGRTETPPDEVSSSIFDDLPSSTAAASEGRLGLNKMADPPTDIVDAASLAAAASSAPTPPAEPAEGTTGAEPGAGTGAETGASERVPGSPQIRPRRRTNRTSFRSRVPCSTNHGPDPPHDPFFWRTEDLAALDAGGEPVLATAPVPAPAADAAGTEPVAGGSRTRRAGCRSSRLTGRRSHRAGSRTGCRVRSPRRARAGGRSGEGRTEGTTPTQPSSSHAGSQPLTSPELPASDDNRTVRPSAESTPADEAGPGGEAGEARHQP